MAVMTLIKRIKDYYNKDGVSMSIIYKGIPITVSDNSEEKVQKSMAQLMKFVDFMEAKKLKQVAIIDPKTLEYA